MNRPQAPVESSQRIPQCSVVVPCLNERDHIAQCLDAILGSSYPLDALEIIVVDGGSTDGTLDILASYAARYPRAVRVLPNPRRITPCGLNIAIRASRADYILWMSAHNTYPSTYIEDCVLTALATGVDNVGGRIETVARKQTVMSDFVVAAWSSSFGVGNSRFRVGGKTGPVEVDTVFGGCYRRDVFEKIGLFNESLVRTQDIEFNRRLTAAGGKILLDPRITSTYFARADFKSFVKYYWVNGQWSLIPFAFSKVVPVSLRHLVPMGFVGAIAGLGVGGVLFHPCWFALGALGLLYGLASVVASSRLASASRKLRFALVMPLIFLSLHLTYGVASWVGAIKAARAFSRHPALRRLPIEPLPHADASLSERP